MVNLIVKKPWRVFFVKALKSVTSIAIANPLRASQIIDAVNRTKGYFLTVSEDNIEKSLKTMGNKGYFIEPTSAATIAGLSHYIKIADKDEIIVSSLTGHGLKAIDKVTHIF